MKTWVKVFLIIVAVIAFIACIACCLYIYQYVVGGRRSEAFRQQVLISDSIAQVVETAMPEETALPAPETSDEPEETPEPELFMEVDIDFASMRSKNSDVYAWIEVPGTIISYPVAQSPDEELYYSTHNIDGSYYSNGTIFSQYYNTTTFQDPVTVLYGHNMKSGAMFAHLNDFADRDVFEENRYIYIYTPEKVYQYEIFAAGPHSSEHLILNYDFSDEETFNSFFSDLLNGTGTNANFRPELFPSFGDKVLTLSTCYRQNRLQRYLVMGVLVQEYTVIQG